MKRRLLVTVAAVAGVALLSWGWASMDRCGTWSNEPPGLVGVGRAAGALRVGAATADVAPKYPVTVGGYGPIRSSASSAAAPIRARAIVIEVGGEKLAFVELDVLLVTAALRSAVAEGAGMPVWLLASHTHSSLGGYDQRLASELAALGSFSADDERALVEAARSALEKARSRLAPAAIAVDQGAAELGVARSGSEVDSRVTRVRFLAPGGERTAQVIIAQAHPTLVEPRTTTLDSDWPGRLADLEPATVTLVLQGAGGNASPRRETAATAPEFARAAAGAVAALPNGEARAETTLAWAETALPLPRPDASRLAPAPFRAVVENVLCDDAEHSASVSAVRLGEVTLLFVPVEPTAVAGRVLEEQAGATRVVSLANGYAGYVDTDEAVRAQSGEAKRQYFSAEFLRLIADAARLAGSAVR